MTWANIIKEADRQRQAKLNAKELGKEMREALGLVYGSHMFEAARKIERERILAIIKEHGKCKSWQCDKGGCCYNKILDNIYKSI